MLYANNEIAGNLLQATSGVYLIPAYDIYMTLDPGFVQLSW